MGEGGSCQDVSWHLMAIPKMSSPHRRTQILETKHLCVRNKGHGLHLLPDNSFPLTCTMHGRWYPVMIYGAGVLILYLALLSLCRQAWSSILPASPTPISPSFGPRHLPDFSQLHQSLSSEFAPTMLSENGVLT